MIKANELRIGNWVYYNKHPEQVTVLSGSVERMGTEPIPLTPEILEKAGFYKANTHDFIKGDIELWQVNNDIHYSVHDDYPIAVKYVHQLQNLYFALTGEELNINL